MDSAPILSFALCPLLFRAAPQPDPRPYALLYPNPFFGPWSLFCAAPMSPRSLFFASCCRYRSFSSTASVVFRFFSSWSTPLTPLSHATGWEEESIATAMAKRHRGIPRSHRHQQRRWWHRWHSISIVHWCWRGHPARDSSRRHRQRRNILRYTLFRYHWRLPNFRRLERKAGAPDDLETSGGIHGELPFDAVRFYVGHRRSLRSGGQSFTHVLEETLLPVFAATHLDLGMIDSRNHWKIAGDPPDVPPAIQHFGCNSPSVDAWRCGGRGMSAFSGKCWAHQGEENDGHYF